MNKITAALLAFIAGAVFVFVITYHSLGLRSPSDYHMKQTEENISRKQCDEAIRSKFYHSSTQYCQSLCAESFVKQYKRYNNMLFDDRYKFIYCPVPKVGSTNWRRTLLVLSGKVNATDPVNVSIRSVYAKYSSKLSSLSSLPPEQIDYRLKHYYKFIFVRDPLERLLSMYINKFIGKHRFAWSRFSRRMIKGYRSAPTMAAVRSGLNATFLEVVQYIVDQSVYAFNRHWQLATVLCSPCHVKYDFVGHLETADQDAARVLQHVGASHVRYPERERDYKYEKTGAKLKLFYDKIPLAYLSKLTRVYSLDYLMFNLTLPPVLRKRLKRYKVQ